jgi:hypothetical protein
MYDSIRNGECLIFVVGHVNCWRVGRLEEFSHFCGQRSTQISVERTEWFIE